MLIKDFAEIKTGFVLNRNRANLNKKSIRYEVLSLKSLQETGELDTSETEIFLAKEEVPANFLTQTGDVLLRLREPVMAVCVSEKKKEHGLLISSLFLKIRIKEGFDILPEYLCMYLNSHLLKKQFAADYRGSNISMISVKTIAELNIKIVDIKAQKKITKLTKLYHEKIKILEKLKEKTEKVFKENINVIINKL